jgi:hypothetical protein
MINELFEYYKKELGAWNLVYKHMKYQGGRLYIAIIIVIAIVGTWYYFHNQIGKTLLTFPLLGIVLGVINEHNKIIIKRVHNVQIKEEFWGGKSFHKLRLKKLKENLSERNIYSIEKLKLLTDRTYKEAENRKFTGFFIPGLTLAMFLSLWNNAISWWFKNAQNVSQAITIIGSTVIIIVYILFITKLLKEITFDIFNRDSNKLKKLGEMLEDIILESSIM